MESGINESDNRIVRLDAEKLSREEAQKFVKSVTLDKTTGVLTVTLADGTQTSVDLDIEKVVTNFDLDEENNLVLTLADGTKKKVPLSKFIDTYTFKSSPTVSFSANGKEITAVIPDGAVTLDKLETSIITTIRQYTLDAQTAKGQAEQAAQTAGGWAIGGLDGFENSNSKYFASQSKRYAIGGVEEGDTSDNAKYYCEEARKAAETASGAAGFDGTAATVSAIDTQDLTGVGKGKKSTVQALLDKIVQKLVEKVVTSDTFQTVLGKYLVNNGLTTEAGKFGLDAAFGKNLQDQITQQNSNMSDIPKQYAALDKENSFTQAQKIISDSIPALQIISGSTGTSKGTFQITARTDINPYSRAAIDLINNGQINGTLYLHEDGFLRWYAHGNTYKINVTQE